MSRKCAEAIVPLACDAKPPLKWGAQPTPAWRMSGNGALYIADMRRLFTYFPAGAPGIALLILRVGLVVSLWQPVLAGGSAMTALRLCGLTALSGAVLVGFVTPVVSA